MQNATPDDLQGHRRMRACLEAIRPLDPAGVAERVAEVDAEIARLETLLGVEARPARSVIRLEIVPIGGRLVRAA